ncbi:MAG: 16S rRNA processing protein RimM [Candidatus Aminicenantes bacterium]|nr:MAG: 16S rRNA processing protein RimM [Candidatus Aminicenantes bacterium]
MLTLLLSLFFSRVFFRREGAQEEYRVESLRSYKNYYIVKLEGINSIAQAREFAGLDVLLPEEDLLPLGENSYYIFQLIGCCVVSKSRERIGSIKDFLFIKDNDLLVIEREDREVLIPFTRAICLEVNLKKKEIVIDPPEGLLELDEI